MSDDRFLNVCSDCGTDLEDALREQPCPKCGSTKRIHRLQVQPGHMQLTGSEVEIKLIRAWDSNSLTLAGVIYGIVVTVLGVVIATLGTLPTVIYAVVVLMVLVVALLLWAQPIIRAMQWLLARGKR
jgi:DNA-directed RNA polymerase subunit RPC12/RpoP